MFRDVDKIEHLDLPPGAGLRGASPDTGCCRSGELTPMFPLVADAPAGEDRKKSGDDEGALPPA